MGVLVIQLLWKAFEEEKIRSEVLFDVRMAKKIPCGLLFLE